MVDWSFEEDSGWGIRVVVRKVKGKLENEACIWCIGGTCDSRSPGKKIVRIVWEGGDTWCGGHHELHQFCLEAVETKSVTAPSGTLRGIITAWSRFGYHCGEWWKTALKLHER